jgi:transposase
MLMGGSLFDGSSVGPTCLEGLSPCLVGMEACVTAHHWARAISALGHTVKMMPPAYVKPYVKRGKTDAADAEAIKGELTLTELSGVGAFAGWSSRRPGVFIER